MKNTRYFIYIITLVILAWVPAALTALPVLRLSTPQVQEMKVGDTFEVSVNLDANDGTYSVFLDLRYDNAVFELQEILPGSLFPADPARAETLSARQPYNEAGRLLISQSLVGRQPLLTNDGELIKLVFRAVGYANTSRIYLDETRTLLYSDAPQARRVNHTALPAFTVRAPYTFFFVQILSPYNNYKSAADRLDWLVQATISNPNYNDRFQVGLRKVDRYAEDAALVAGSQEVLLPVTNGQAFFRADQAGMFRLNAGINYVAAVLYVNGSLKAAAVKRVYYDALDRGVKIISPVDNAIVSRHRIVVSGKSDFRAVEVNNILVPVNPAGPDQYAFQLDNFYLKEGFNKITVTTKNPEQNADGIVYKDTAVVYYQRDESLFGFLQPGENMVFKEGTVAIRGLIDTIDKEKILVKMRAHFQPFAAGINDYDYVFADTDSPAPGEIRLSELTDTENVLLSHYGFAASFDLARIADYSSGILTFYALKIDKQGENADLEISRSIVIDRSGLEIDLRQPNLISRQILGSAAELGDFLVAGETDENICIAASGELSLRKKEAARSRPDPLLANMNTREVVTTGDGTSYAIVNQPNRIEIYKREAGAEHFTGVICPPHFQAYAHCALEFGNNNLLLGISDYKQGEGHPCGLLLYNNKLLRTARLPYTVNEIQFIKRDGSDYYLYASNFTYLYKFSADDVIISQYNPDYFEIRNLKRYYLPCNLYINSFYVTQGGSYVVLGTELGVQIYRFIENGYSLAVEFKKGYPVIALAGAELESDYKVYLCAYYADPGFQPGGTTGVQPPVSLATITEKNGTFTETGCTVSYETLTSIKAIGQNRFLIAGKPAGAPVPGLQICTALYGLEQLDSLVIPPGTAIEGKNSACYFNEKNFLLYGKGLVSVEEEYNGDGGALTFRFTDSFVEGICGFSFCSQPRLAGLLTVDYLLTDTPGSGSWKRLEVPGNPVAGSNLSLYSYRQNTPARYLQLVIHLGCSQSGSYAPALDGLTIIKKEIVRTTADSLQVRGFIHDATVRDGRGCLTINSKKQELGEGGSFADIIALDTSRGGNRTRVDLQVVNESGRSAALSFQAEYVQNEPGLGDIRLIHAGGQEEAIAAYLPEEANDFAPVITTGDKIDLTGNFSGLHGVQVTASLYTLDQNNAAERFIAPAYRAEFTTVADSNGERRGRFLIKGIRVVPGSQRIIVKCSNPYGTSRELKFDVDFHVADEQVEITNFTLAGSKLAKIFGIKKNSRNLYQESFELTGRVITSNMVEQMTFRSDNDYITFTGGDGRDIKFLNVPLNSPDKSFRVTVNLKMGDDNERLVERFKLWPASLQLNNLGRYIYVEFQKEFEGIKPDFSTTKLNADTGNIDLKFSFGESFPENMLLRLRFNHQPVDPAAEYSPLKRRQSSPAFTYAAECYTYTRGIQAREGTNILDWLLFMDKGEPGVYNSEKPMSSGELEFTYTNGEPYTPFTVVFPPGNRIYNRETLQAAPLQITCDPRGELQIKLNNLPLALNAIGTGKSREVDLTAFDTALKEGRNKSEVTFKLESANIDHYQWEEFDYDSLPPGVKITSLEFSTNAAIPCVTAVTAEIAEDNLAKVSLVYRNAALNVVPAITIADANRFLYRWQGLEALAIIPTEENGLYAEAADITGKKGQSQVIRSGQYKSFDIQLSNALADTKVLNAAADLDPPGGTDDAVTDYSAYWNEQNPLFPYHLKYEATRLADATGRSLRDNITGNFTKETIFPSNRKYLMFELDDPASALNMDLAYQCHNTLARGALVTPVSLLEHTEQTFIPRLNTKEIGIQAGKTVYSIVRGFRAPDSQYEKYTGFAKDVKVYKNNALVIDWLDQNKDGIYGGFKDGDYKSVIVYALTESARDGIPVLPATGNEVPVPGIPVKEDKPILPVIKLVLDDSIVQKVQDIKIYANYLFVICGTDGIVIYDLAKINSTNPVIDWAGVLVPAGGPGSSNLAAYDAIWSGNYLFVAQGADGIAVYDVKDITRPVYLYTMQDNRFAPVRMCEEKNNCYAVSTTGEVIRNNNCYAVSATGAIVRYVIDDDSITAGAFLGAAGGLSPASRLWWQEEKLYVVPAEGSFIQVYTYNPDALTYEQEIRIPCTNAPGQIGASLFFPCNDRVCSNNPPAAVFENIQGSRKSLALAVNGPIIYSAGGDDGLRVLVADESGKTTFADFGQSGFVLGSGSCSQAGTGELSMSFTLDTANTTASRIYKMIDPPVLLSPSKKIKARFVLDGNDTTCPVFRIRLTFRDYGVVSGCYISANATEVSSGAHFKKESAGVWVEEELSLESFGIHDADYLEKVELSLELCRVRTPGTYNGYAYLESVTIPEYLAFSLPLSHAALKIDEDPGQESDSRQPLGLLNNEMFVPTRSGRAVVALELQTGSLQNRFTELSNENVSTGGTVATYYNQDYFNDTERRNRYLIGQCPDDQVLSDETSVNLARLNTYNTTEFNTQVESYFQRRADEGVSRFQMSYATENTGLVNPPPDGSYRIYLTDTLVAAPPTDGAARISAGTSKFVRIPRTRNGALSFWLRLEDEIPWFTEYANAADYNTAEARPLAAWGGETEQETCYRFVFKPRALAFVQYKAGSALNKTDNDIEAGNILSVEIENAQSGSFYGRWHLVTLSWSEDGGLVFYVNDKRINAQPFHMRNFDWNKFLHPKLVFGDTGQDTGSCYFSLAAPRIFNKALNDYDVGTLYAAANSLQGHASDLEINFDGSLAITKQTDSADDLDGKLPVYEETLNGQGLVITGGITNYISGNIAANGLMLTDSFAPANLIKVDTASVYDAAARTLTIRLAEGSAEGFYHLTDGSGGTFGIPGAESYTFYGTLLTENLSAGDLCVIKLNGMENTFTLTSGEFQFTCLNSGQVLNSIDVYFRTSKDLVFKADSFGFNCGRYRGNNGTSYPDNYLHMRHRFYHKESVVLYYDPLFNNAWELNGEEVVIADSVLYRIGIHNNQYYAVLKTTGGEITLTASAALAGGLHQLAVIYDFSTGDFRFYLDAALEASYQGVRFGLPANTAGVFPDVYNLSIGSSLADDRYKARGLFDYFLIRQETIQEKELMDDFLARTRLVSVEGGPLFDHRNIALTLHNNTDRYINLAYGFDSGDKEQLTIEPNGSAFVSGECELGAHRLLMDIDTGEFHKTETYRFVVNYAPVIELTASTPFIIRGNRQFFFQVERPLENRYGNRDKYIVVELYMDPDPARLDSHLVQTIAEDRAAANPGVYTRDDNPMQKRADILFETNYNFPPEARQVHYRLRAYYYGEESTTYTISGQVRVLDIEEPVITRFDEVNKRPWKVGTGIKDFSGQQDCLKNLQCRYDVLRMNDEQEYEILEDGMCAFNQEGKITIDVYRYRQPGNYRVVFEPTDEKGGTGIVKVLTYSITGDAVSPAEQLPGTPQIDNFDLILLDKTKQEAAFNLNCGVAGLRPGEVFRVIVECASDLTNRRTLLDEEAANAVWQRTVYIPALEAGAGYQATARLIYNGQEINRQYTFTCNSQVVDVRIIHGPPGLIGYNNVFFNWQGYLNGENSSALTYEYMIDDSPWGYTPENALAFYNLADGRHRFSIRAFDKTGRAASGTKSAFFDIDTANPLIAEEKITLGEVRDNLGIVTHLTLNAATGAVQDFSLAWVTVNGQAVNVQTNGAFEAAVIPLETDGINPVEITACDRLGNMTRVMKEYDYTILEIAYPVKPADPDKPAEAELARYSPLTVYGRIAAGVPVPEDFRITVYDPFGQRTAIINFDRTFFIENVRINPGSEFKGIQTVLTFCTSLGNGKTVIRKYPVAAGAVLKPVEFDLSVHAVPGGAATTRVDMQGFCRADNITCWSFDYDGDGVYEDDVYTNEKTISRPHSYSSVGVINPRVRVITADNQIFSWQDTLLIHDKIIKADVADLTGALAVDIVEVDPREQDTDGFEYVYLLQQEQKYFQVKRYLIEANSAPYVKLLDDSSVRINLSQLNINYPRSIKVDKNLDIYAASLYGTGSRLFRLVPGSGGYRLDESFKVVFTSEIISSFTLDNGFIYISLENTQELVKYGKDGSLVLRSRPFMNHIGEDTGRDAGLEAAGDRIWLGDYLNTRVISLSAADFVLRDFFGEPGNAEGQFIHPKIVRVRDKYVFVLDQSEKTLQVFEAAGDEYRIICRIDSTADYLTPGFLNYVTDFTVFTKLENKRRYYYIALVNNYPGQVALLRIPQWQPDSVRVKSNLIVYVKNNEIFTAKPDGADTRKIFSSGALPGVDGNVDYPALAPDGSTIVFISRIERLEYTTDDVNTDSKKYDKLYLVNTDGTGCTLVTDPAIQDKELERPQFSYNGSKIVFSAKGRNEYWTIYEYDRDKKTVAKLFTPRADCRRPTYAPDDRYLAYVTCFYNHNEIAIFDTENPDRIIYLTNNDYPDDDPVWAPVYDGEIQSDLKGIKSRIAFVSKPDFEERIFYTYIAQETSEDFRVVTANGSNTGDNPDAARNALSNIDYPALGNIGYPCFTSDGQTIIFESYNQGAATLRQYNMKTKTESPTGVPEGARRPAGMKNRIVNFRAGVVDGNTLAVSWNKYAEEDLIYTVTYKSSEKDALWAEESFQNQTQARIKGLTMGLTYQVRVYIKDRLRGGEVTTSVIKKAVVYPVVARPAVEIDAFDPYKVRLSAWKPESDKPWEKEWKFKWMIDNVLIEETFNDFTEYIFSVPGKKRVALEVSLNNDPAKVHRSEDVIVDIKGDLTPRIEYKLVTNNDAQVIELDGSTSSGSRIDMNHFSWKISGYNINNALSQINIQDAVRTIQAIDGFKGDIDVTLTITGIPVMGARETVREEKSVTKRIALGLNEITPIIIAAESDTDAGVYSFDGSQSVGNIDWTTSRWEVLGPADDLHPDGVYKRDQAVAATTCILPERNEDTYYRVVLTCRGKSSSKTVSAAKVVQAGKHPVVPVVDYKVITTRSTSSALGAAEEIVTAKLLLNAASSRGSNIDWNNITWNLPLAGDYGGSSTQKGPAVIYNLNSVAKGLAVDVELTVPRKGTGELSQVHQVITIADGEAALVPCIELVKNDKKDLYSTAEGDVYLFSALNSQGPNIDWNNVQWLIDNQYNRQGPVVRLDQAASGENNQAIVVTLILRSTTGGEPVTKTASFNVKRKEIDIVISQNTKKTYLEAKEHNMVTLSVRDSQGQNIDWERTRWFIYQGPEDIISSLYGAEVVHTFPVSNDVEYYPVYVQMFNKGSTRPFIKNINVKVMGDRLQAIIKEEYTQDTNETDKYVRTFTAADSLGENIDWQNCKWTFGDSSEYQYGPVVTHRFPYNNDNAYYTVTVTVSRRTKDGKTEISTDSYTAYLAKDELKAKVTVQQVGNYVVFSAEQSEGRGLLLDRSMWLFEGADSENSGTSETEYGYEQKNVRTDSYSFSNSMTIGTQSGFQGSDGVFFFSTNNNFGASWSFSNMNTFLTDEQISQSSGESSNNIYSGASCRKMIDGWLHKRVTLVIYRALPDGTIEAQSKSFIYTAGETEVRVIE